MVIKTVVFGTAFGEEFSVNFEEENSCIVSWEVVTPQFFTVSVSGTNKNQRKTLEPPTPPVYESLLTEIDTLNKDFENFETASGYNVGVNSGNLPVIKKKLHLSLNKKKQTQFSQQARRIA